MSIYKLENPMIHSHWGCTSSMTALFGYANPEQKPMAELWMGAHPSAPSSLVVQGKQVRLDEWIASHSERLLGSEVAKRFEHKLPYLFKVLSARSPLSIQSHPTKEQATEGWKRENALNIPLTSPTRNYKDDNHKPELVFALTPYHALNGFRPVEEMISLWQPLIQENANPQLQELTKHRNDDSLKGFYQTLMTAEKPKALVESILTRCLNLLEIADLNTMQREAYQLVVRLHEFYPGDIGVLSPLLLNYIVLQPGQAMFLKAGTLHAYLKGTALELMANSDNVLRGGLTPKHVDVSELLQTTHFSPLAAQDIYCKVTKTSENVVTFDTPAPDFQLSIISLPNESNSEQVSNANRPEILFILEGNIKITSPQGETITLKCGESAFVPADITEYTIAGKGKIALATSGNLQ